MLYCPLGQATGTNADDASTIFTGSTEEMAHNAATCRVSRGSMALGTRVVELGTVPLPSLWKHPHHPLTLSI